MPTKVLCDLASNYFCKLFYCHFPPGLTLLQLHFFPLFLETGQPSTCLRVSAHSYQALLPDMRMKNTLPVSRPLLGVLLTSPSLSSSHFALFFFIEIFFLTYYSYLFVIILLLLKLISKRMPVFFIAVSLGPIAVLCL